MRRRMRRRRGTCVMEYRGTKKKIPQIARELNVAYVLEGSVQRTGGSVRITGQLIRAATDAHVWARNFDRELSTLNAQRLTFNV
jgi:TolB-like protein